MFIPNVDTLISGIDIEDYGLETKDLLVELEDKKKEAKLVAAKNASDFVTINLGDHRFKVMPNGSAGHAYILHDEFHEIKLAQFRSTNKEFYPIQVKLKSSCLWSKGFYEAWMDLCDIINSHVGRISRNKINRMDLCCHTDEILFNIEEMEKFKGKYINENIIRDNRHLTGMSFGVRKNSKIYCRIYNKSLEVNKKRNKMWFKYIWKQNGMKIDDVWNVEFELKRKFFREFNIETVEDAFESMKNIWKYCTSIWLVKVELTDKRMERCPVNPEWEGLQKSFEYFSGRPLVKREKQIEMESSILVPSATGYLTSYGAKLGIVDKDELMKRFITDSGEYLYRSKDSNFRNEILKKQQTINRAKEVK